MSDPVSWNNPGSDVLENAANGKQALFIYFPGEKDTDDLISGADYKDLSGRLAQFVRVAYNNDREPSPTSVDTLVPASKILSENPSRDYKVTAYPSFLVTDSYGNEMYRVTGKKPTAKELEGYFNTVATKMDGNNKKLQKNLEEAKKAWEAKDSAKAMTKIRSNFKDGLVGLDAQTGTIELYHSIIEASRAAISEADVKKLSAMKATFKGTEIEKDINDALKASK